jgi:hypothetical protein
MKRITPIHAAALGLAFFAVGFVWLWIVFHRIDVQMRRNWGPDWGQFVDLDRRTLMPPTAGLLLRTGTVIVIASIVWAIARGVKGKFSS